MKQLSVDYFPEAHFYLHYKGQDIDVTFPEHSPTVKASVIKRYAIDPGEIGDQKIKLHQGYLRHWLKNQGIDTQFTFQKVWQLREEWINSLSS